MQIDYIIIVLLVVLIALVVFLGRRLFQPPAPDARLDAVLSTLDVHRQALERLGVLPDRLDDVRTRVVAGGEQQKHLQDYLAETRRTIEDLNRRLAMVAQSEDKSAELLDRLHRVLLGASSRGRKGENLLREQLAAFPPSMLATNFRLGTQTVEFALRLPDDRVLPIDSKWPEPQLVERLEAASTPEEQTKCKKDLENVVLRRVSEIKKYIDPTRTASLAVAALPDPVFAVVGAAHYAAFKHGVLLVSYSNAAPILLALYGLFMRYAQTWDMEQVKSHLGSLDTLVTQVESIIDNKVARGGTMIANAADECRDVTLRMRRSLAAVGGAQAAPSLTEKAAPDFFPNEDNR